MSAQGSVHFQRNATGILETLGNEIFRQGIILAQCRRIYNEEVCKRLENFAQGKTAHPVTLHVRVYRAHDIIGCQVWPDCNYYCSS